MESNLHEVKQMTYSDTKYEMYMITMIEECEKEITKTAYNHIENAFWIGSKHALKQALNKFRDEFC